MRANTFGGCVQVAIALHMERGRLHVPAQGRQGEHTGLFNNYIHVVRFSKNLQTSKAGGIVAIVVLESYDSLALSVWIVFFEKTNEVGVVIKQG